MFALLRDGDATAWQLWRCPVNIESRSFRCQWIWLHGKIGDGYAPKSVPLPNEPVMLTACGSSSGIMPQAQHAAYIRRKCVVLPASQRRSEYGLNIGAGRVIMLS